MFILKAGRVLLATVSFVENTLRKEQHAYEEGKSAETALAEVVTEIEKGIKSGFALTILLDIESAFNHTSVESICQGAREHEVPDPVERWMRRLLVSRRVVAEWKQLSPKVWVGCLHGGGGTVSHNVVPVD